MDKTKTVRKTAALLRRLSESIRMLQVGKKFVGISTKKSVKIEYFMRWIIYSFATSRYPANEIFFPHKPCLYCFFLYLL